jgi:hypothetical protein
MLSARSGWLSDVKMTSVHHEGNILSTSIHTDENISESKIDTKYGRLKPESSVPVRGFPKICERWKRQLRQERPILSRQKRVDSSIFEIRLWIRTKIIRGLHGSPTYSAGPGLFPKVHHKVTSNIITISKFDRIRQSLNDLFLTQWVNIWPDRDNRAKFMTSQNIID